MAVSTDGQLWTRVSDTIPIISGLSSDATALENEVIYQPYLVEVNGTYCNFYNALEPIWSPVDTNAKDGGFPGIDFTTNVSKRQKSPASILPAGPWGSVNSQMATDPKIYWDDDQKL